jgi:hypothetical protein
MARISNSLVQVRETFVYNAFKANSQLTVDEAQGILKQEASCCIDDGNGGHKGIMMATNRIYQIKKAADAGEPIPPTNKVGKGKKAVKETAAEASKVEEAAVVYTAASEDGYPLLG